MKKRIKYILIPALAVILLTLYILRVIAVNKDMKDAPLITYRIGEEVMFEDDILMDFTMKGYSITITDAEILTYEEYLKKYDLKDRFSDMPEKVYDVTILLKNIDADAETGLNFKDFSVQSGAERACFCYELYGASNPKVGGEYAVALRSDSEMEFYLPFALWEADFRTKTWNNLEDLDMNFVATLYPNKKVVRLKK